MRPRQLHQAIGEGKVEPATDVFVVAVEGFVEAEPLV